MEPITFIKNLTLIHDYAGEPFRLDQWQAEIVNAIFDPAYREVQVWLPKGNAKTTLCAACILYQLMFGKPQSNIVSIATKREQAALLFDFARLMILQDNYLARRIRIRESTKTLFGQNNTVYNALSCDGKGAHGANISHCYVDELAQFRTNKQLEMFGIFRAGLAKRKDSKLISISHASDPDPESLGYREFSKCKRVLSGEVKIDGFKPIVYQYDGPDIYNEANWLSCNPAIASGFKSIESLREQAQQAKINPIDEINFCVWHLNQWRIAETIWLDPALLDRCPRVESIDNKTPVVCGLDLSRAQDLTSLAIYDPQSKVVLSHNWLPSEALASREKRDNVCYSDHLGKGLELIDGELIDEDILFTKLVEILQNYNVYGIACDKWHAHQLASRLIYAGFPAHLVGQSYADLTFPVKKFETLLLQSQLSHQHLPIYRWALGNVVIEGDDTGRRRTNKKKSSGRIDPIQATLQALQIDHLILGQQ